MSLGVHADPAGTSHTRIESATASGIGRLSDAGSPQEMNEWGVRWNLVPLTEPTWRHRAPLLVLSRLAGGAHP